MTKKEKRKQTVIACLLIAICFFGGAILNKIFAQTKARIDTVQGKPIFTDEKGIKYDVLRSDKTGKSYFVNNKGDKQFLFRREKKSMPTVF